MKFKAKYLKIKYFEYSANCGDICNCGGKGYSFNTLIFKGKIQFIRKFAKWNQSVKRRKVSEDWNEIFSDSNVRKGKNRKVLIYKL